MLTQIEADLEIVLKAVITVEIARKMSRAGMAVVLMHHDNSVRTTTIYFTTLTLEVLKMIHLSIPSKI